jgi:3-methyladenine DNA glycosylase Tag
MNNFTDEKQDVAGVYLELYKEYHDQEWGIQFMTMLHYLNFTT